MGEIATYHWPQEVANVENRQLRGLIFKDIQAKSRNPSFIVGEEVVQFPASQMSTNQFASYRRSLIEWGLDPVNPPHGIDGHGYSLMLTQVLRHVLRDSKDLIIRQTPATLDFLENRHAGEWGPSADIFIGQQAGNHIVPLALIDAVAGSRDRSTRKIHSKLNIPVISMAGDKLFGNGKDAVFSFGMSPSPVDYAQSLAQAAGPKILHKLERI
ncbi:MAG: hypothetical protein NTV98_02540 [Candidatus Roizmanbacteria bacterium]|nr:hypothetical protein [Candidatus Roizmanbacteria bacterium]